jgi:response regulator RpfG family c-di-GMP phosphodiesterase
MYLPWHQRAHRDNKAKILLADDNFDMREYVARLLSAKYEVISVSNGPHPLLPPTTRFMPPLSSRNEVMN